MSKTTQQELLMLKSRLRKCKSILIRRINSRRDYNLDYTAYETYLEIVNLKIKNINKKLKKVYYEQDITTRAAH